MQTALITGANRGIGLELARQLVAGGYRVFATCRTPNTADDLHALQSQSPQQISLHPLNVAQTADYAALIAAMTQATPHLDLLFNNAGIMHDHETLANLSAEILLEQYTVNTVAPAMLSQACLPLLRQSPCAVIVNLSSSFASIGRKTSATPYRYSYSMSKAALNMLTRTLAFELAADNILAVAIHPGWTRTGIGGPQAQFSAAEAAANLLNVVANLTTEHSGQYLNWLGEPLAW